MAAKMRTAQSSTSRRHVLTRSFSTRLVIHQTGAMESRDAENCEDNFRGSRHAAGALVIQHSSSVQRRDFPLFLPNQPVPPLTVLATQNTATECRGYRIGDHFRSASHRNSARPRARNPSPELALA